MTDLSPRPVDTGLEEAAATRTEKFLAFLLGAFLLVGLVWAYVVPLDRTDDVYDSYVDRPAAVVVRDDAQAAVGEAEAQLTQRQSEEATARETYRTQLDAQQPGLEEKAAFERAQQATRDAQAALTRAQAALAAVKPAGDAAERAAQQAFDSKLDARQRDTFLLRLGFGVVVLGGSFFFLDRARRRRSRAVTPWMGAVGASSLLAVGMAADYLDLRDVGPIALSAFGTAATVAVIVAYQRWLAARLPERRARKNECPWCGYPTRAGAPHCEGCGRQVVGTCTSCSGPRRAGVAFCGACGAT